jgi:Domain of unknown function (DUF4189)
MWLNRPVTPILLLLAGAAVLNAHAAHGASSIVLSPSTGNYSYAVGLPTIEEARAQALRVCAQYAPDCKEVSSWRWPGYLAIVRGDNGMAVAQGHDAQADAQRAAFDGCEQRYSGCALQRVLLDDYGWNDPERESAAAATDSR